MVETIIFMYTFKEGTDEMRICKYWSVVLLYCGLCIGLGLTGCGPPKEVSQLAISKAKELVKTHWMTRNSITKDFQVKSIEKRKISQADKANGIEAIWNVKIAFLSTEVGTRSGKWYDQSSTIKVIKKNGKLVAK